MKKCLVLFVIFTFSVLAFTNFETYNQRFYEANSQRNAEAMYNLIQDLSAFENSNDGMLLALYADSMIEYAGWATRKDDEKEMYYEKAVEIGKKAVTLNDNVYTNYVTGLAIGRLAQFKGIIQSIFMLGDFDKYIDKVLKHDPNFFLGHIAKGLRYRDTPFPFRSKKKAEEHLRKAIESQPDYGYSYYELAVMLSEDRKTVNEAKELLQKVIDMPPFPRFYAAELQTVIDAEELLNKLK